MTTNQKNRSENGFYTTVGENVSKFEHFRNRLLQLLYFRIKNKLNIRNTMKVNDLIFRYSFRGNSKRDGICRVRTFVNSHFRLIVLITDLDLKKTSDSITNSIEVIYNSLIDRLIVPKNSIFIEHYEPSSISSHIFSIVTIKNGNETLWEDISFEYVIKLIECDEYEIKSLTLQNKVLINEIEKLRTIIDPHLDLPSQVESSYLIRQFEIEDNIISKLEVSELINNNAIEHQLLELLKRDLSILAEVYANPNDNYICLSDFPMNGGFIDFVLLTGVSRMDVFLIEIKGANFNILNQGFYQKFNYRIETAIGQIRDRLGYIHRNMDEFRKNIHSIRERVISGESLHNSFIGPDDTIRVDKNKDVNIHSVIIGGRTIDDLKESRKRSDLEWSLSLPIKLESWDTFLRKLRRN